jgi:hypothetical protein
MVQCLHRVVDGLLSCRSERGQLADHRVVVHADKKERRWEKVTISKEVVNYGTLVLLHIYCLKIKYFSFKAFVWFFYQIAKNEISQNLISDPSSIPESHRTPENN